MKIKEKKNLNNVPINLKWNNTKNILYMKGRFENTQNPPFIRTTNTNEIINKNRKKQIEYSKNILNSNKIKKIN
jgi:precorrin-6x reductase